MAKGGAALPRVGILTPATEANVVSSAAWQQFLTQLASLGWYDKITVEIVFKHADGDDDNLDHLANQLVGMVPQPKVIVADGTTAAGKVLAIAPATLKVVQAVGGFPVAGGPANLSGFHINVHDTTLKRMDRLNKKFDPANITLLYDKKSAVTKNGVLKDVMDQAPKNIIDRGVDNLDGLRSLTNADVQDSFMLLPSAMFFHNAFFIARTLVEAAGVPAIYPEREYWRQHTPPYRSNVIVHGHDVPSTFRKAARQVGRLLQNLGVDPPSGESDTDQDS